MAMGPLPLTGDEASKAMLNGLTSRVREELRERILSRIQPDVDAAVDAALGSFKAAIESYHEAHELRNTVRVIIERKDNAA